MNKKRYHKDYEKLIKKLNELLSIYKSNEKTSEIAVKKATKFSCDRAIFAAAQNAWNLAALLLKEIISWGEKR